MNMQDIMDQEVVDALQRQSRNRSKEPSWKEEKLTALDDSSQKLIDQVLPNRNLKHRLEKLLNGISNTENLYDMHIPKISYNEKTNEMKMDLLDADGHNLGEITGNSKGIFPNLNFDAVKNAQQELQRQIAQEEQKQTEQAMEAQAKQMEQEEKIPNTAAKQKTEQTKTDRMPNTTAKQKETQTKTDKMPNTAAKTEKVKETASKSTPSWMEQPAQNSTSAKSADKEPAISEESRSALEQTITDEKVRNNVENFMSDVAMDNKTNNVMAVDIQYNEKTKEVRVAMEDKDGKDLGTITGNDKDMKLMDKDAIAKETEEAKAFSVNEQDLANNAFSSYKEVVGKELKTALESINALEGAAAMPQMADAFNAIRENLQSISAQGINEMKQAMDARVDAAKDAIGNMPDDLVQADKEVQKGFEEMANTKRETIRDIGDKFKGTMDKVREAAAKMPAKMTSIAEKGALEAVNHSKLKLLKQYEIDTVQRKNVFDKLDKQRKALNDRIQNVRQHWTTVKTFITGKNYSTQQGPKLFEAITNARMSKITRQMEEQRSAIAINAREATALKDRVERSVETVRTFNKNHDIVEAPSVRNILQSAENRAKTVNLINAQINHTVDRSAPNKGENAR